MHMCLEIKQMFLCASPHIHFVHSWRLSTELDESDVLLSLLVFFHNLHRPYLVRGRKEVGSSIYRPYPFHKKKMTVYLAQVNSGVS